MNRSLRIAFVSFISGATLLGVTSAAWAKSGGGVDLTHVAPTPTPPIIVPAPPPWHHLVDGVQPNPGVLYPGTDTPQPSQPPTDPPNSPPTDPAKAGSGNGSVGGNAPTGNKGSNGDAGSAGSASASVTHTNVVSSARDGSPQRLSGTVRAPDATNISTQAPQHRVEAVRPASTPSGSSNDLALLVGGAAVTSALAAGLLVIVRQRRRTV